MDTLVLRKPGEHLWYKNQSNDNILMSAILQLQIGDKVDYKIGCKIAASSKLIFIRGSSYQTRYGNTTIGNGKALFLLERVKMLNTKLLPAASIYNRSIMLSHIKKNLEASIIIVLTSSLEKKLDIQYSHAINELNTRNTQIDMDDIL